MADLYKGEIVELTASLAVSAAVISDRQKLPLADSLILAVARSYDAILWTQDEHFSDIENVKYIPAK